MVMQDDLFGYGPNKKLDAMAEKWWNWDLHEYGLDKHHYKDPF